MAVRMLRAGVEKKEMRTKACGRRLKEINR
jgi:hypothetical protein